MYIVFCLYNIFSVRALQAYAHFVNSIKSVPTTVEHDYQCLFIHFTEIYTPASISILYIDTLCYITYYSYILLLLLYLLFSITIHPVKYNLNSFENPAPYLNVRREFLINLIKKSRISLNRLHIDT